MKAIPDEEIRTFAQKIGAIDENGNYTTPRNKLAAGALEYRRALAEAEAAADDVDTTPTVDRLLHFADEFEESFSGGIHPAILAAVAGALVQRDGLHLHNEGNPA